MSDVYATIQHAGREVQERLADVIESRAADPRYQSMVRAYLSEIDFPPHTHALEIGCGTGSITRVLARWPNVERAVGVDPSAVFIERARQLSEAMTQVSFQEGDGRALPLGAQSFDVAVVNTTLCHVPQPELLLAEAFRVLRPGGWLAVFDGDYVTATVARGEFDPLQACVGAFLANFVNDPWLVRRLPQLLRAAGFELFSLQSHGYVEASMGTYMLTWIDRGADALLQAGSIGEQFAEALKAEARRRSAKSQWFGHIAFGSAIARTPEPATSA
jgi:ubiquinone/menaquinone biosynthesis C-methylase UbiE